MLYYEYISSLCIFFLYLFVYLKKVIVNIYKLWLIAKFSYDKKKE